MADQHKMSSGVQELIDRLRDDGVRAGRDQAQRMMSDAQEKAAHMIAAATKDAEEIMTKARAEIEAERAAAKESLKTAIRDTELMLEAELKTGFSAHVKRLVSMELKEREFLRTLIMAVAGRVCKEIPEGARAEVLLPPDVFEKDEKGVRLTEQGKGQMHHLVLGIAGDMLREGLVVRRLDDGQVGLKIRLVGEDVEIDLTDNAIADVLLKFLLPRYRAIVAGVE